MGNRTVMDCSRWLNFKYIIHNLFLRGRELFIDDIHVIMSEFMCPLPNGSV